MNADLVGPARDASARRGVLGRIAGWRTGSARASSDVTSTRPRFASRTANLIWRAKGGPACYPATTVRAAIGTSAVATASTQAHVFRAAAARGEREENPDEGPTCMRLGHVCHAHALSNDRTTRLVSGLRGMATPMQRSGSEDLRQ